MRTFLMTAAILTAFTTSSLAAGQGTIRETDTAIYVEYSDEAEQVKPANAEPQPGPATGQAQQQEEQKKKEETVLNERRKQKYNMWATEWAEPREKMEQQNMDNEHVPAE